MLIDPHRRVVDPAVVVLRAVEYECGAFEGHRIGGVL